MSVVALKNYKDKIVIGADNQITRGLEKDKCTKLFYEEENNIYYGTAGKLSELIAFQIFLETNKPAGETVRDIRDFFVSFIKNKINNMDEHRLYNDYIFVYKNIPFIIYHDLSITIIDTFESIGSGSYHTNTSLYLGNTVKKSIEVACELNLYCNYPVTLFEIKKDKK